jgi:hypothetical protein
LTKESSKNARTPQSVCNHRVAILVHTKQKTVGHGRVSATSELQYWFHSLLKGLDRHRTFALRRTGPLVSHWRNFRFGSERRSRLARRVLAWRRLQRRWRLPGKRFAVSSPCSRSLIGASKCRQAASAFMPIAMRLWQIIQSEARPVGRTPHETRMLRAVSNPTARGFMRFRITEP